METVSVDVSPEKKCKVTSDVVPMDWEEPIDTSPAPSSDDDNAFLAEDNDCKENTPLVPGSNINIKHHPCMKLRFVEGPGAGSCLDTYKGSIIIVGRDPKPKTTMRASISSMLYHSTPFDEQILTKHLKLEVKATKNKTMSVHVTNLGSTIGTIVNGKQLAEGGSVQAFVGGRIKLGNSTLAIECA